MSNEIKCKTEIDCGFFIAAYSAVIVKQYDNVTHHGTEAAISEPYEYEVDANIWLDQNYERLASTRDLAKFIRTVDYKKIHAIDFEVDD